MSNIILFDTDARSNLLPLTATRPMGELRIGMLTLREKWERYLQGKVSYITQEYLQQKYPILIEEDNLIVNSSIVPNPALCAEIRELKMFEALLLDGELVAARLSEGLLERLIEDEEVHELKGTELDKNRLPVATIRRLWDLTPLNGKAIAEDFDLLTQGRRSQLISPTNQVMGADKVFLEEGVRMECCILNATTGPIYIGKNAEVMEGSMLRGPIAIGDEAGLKMGAKIYGPTTIGPGCRVGGEVTRSILMANSNKGHEGYLGDSVLGEWCNLGADTNNSNLKNNYAEVRLWDYEEKRFVPTGLQFCGLIMGDHTKCAINTMFNTGTVAGVFANIFGAGFQRNFIPDFAWGGPDTAYRTYKFEEACETAAKVMSRRKVPITDWDIAILKHIFEQTAPFRSWEI
jgi:UDP-N-acetylglucosamine diphosphorylase/glucosamine-1-phosphate N-acetyltransferase